MKIGPHSFERTNTNVNHHALSSENTAVIEPTQVATTAINASSNPRLASLTSLPRSVLGQIADNFPLGSKDSGRLTAVNRSLREDMSVRSEADRLIAAANNPSGKINRADFFHDIIAKAQTLTPDLRYAVLHYVVRVLPNNLRTPANSRMHKVFQALQIAIDGIPSAHYRYALLYAMAKQFSLPTFRQDYCDRKNYKFSKSGMEAMFRQFKSGALNFVTANISTVERMAWRKESRLNVKSTGDLNVDTPSSSSSPKISAVADTLTILAQGLYLIDDKTRRCNTWKELLHFDGEGVSTGRAKLVVVLSAVMGDLEDQVDREMAFAAILKRTPDMPAEFLPSIIYNLSMHLPGLGNTACHDNFLALRNIASSTPQFEFTCLRFLLGVRDERLEAARHSLIGVTLPRVKHFPAAEASALLCTLASLVPYFRDGERRLQHFDEVWQIAAEISPNDAFLHTVELNAAIPFLSPPNAQYPRFDAALDFVSATLLPVVTAHAAVEVMQSLIDAAFQIEMATDRVASVHQVLRLIESQPPSQQVVLLNLFHAWMNGGSAGLRTLSAGAAARALKRLPPADQVLVLSKATYAIFKMDEPNARIHLGKITALCDAMPEQMQQSAWQEVLDGFEEMFDTLEDSANASSDPAALQEFHRQLLENTELLPMDVRRNVLASAIDAIEVLNPEIFPTARQDTHAQIGRLPASIQAALLAPQHLANATS